MLHHRRLAAGAIVSAIAIAAAACGSSATQAPTAAPPAPPVATPAPATPAPATPAPAESAAPAGESPNTGGALPSFDLGSFFPHDDPALESKIPDTVNGVKLSKASSKGVASASGAGGLFSNPFAGFMGAFGANTSTAFGFDSTGTSDFVIFVMQFTGDASAAMQQILPAIAASQDVKSSTGNVGGKNVTIVTGSSGPAYLYATGNLLYIVAGKDDAMNQAALGALP